MKSLSQIKDVAVRALRNHKARFTHAGMNATSGVDILRAICLYQQHQIEFLARVLSKLHPDEYLKEAAVDADVDGYLPDIPDEEDLETVAEGMAENAQYTAIYTESWQSGSHRNVTVHHRQIQRYPGELVKDMLTREGILDNTVFLFEGWPSLEQPSP